MKNKKKNNKKQNNNNHSNKNKGSLVHQTGSSLTKGQAIFQRNMQALKSKYPELAERVLRTFVMNYEVIPASPGNPPTLAVKSHNFTYYDPVDPKNDVQNQLAALNLKNTRLAVFLGFGLGYELIYFTQNMAKAQNTNYILVIEKDLEIFKVALQTTDVSSLISNDKIRFMVGLPEKSLYVELRNYLAENSRFMFLRALKPIYHLSSLRLYKDYYLNALKQLRESGTHQVMHFGNCPHDSLIGVENMLENLDEIVFNPGINLLLNKFKGRPAVVISTGPSLNKNKHLLKGLENKALLVAADASLKVMMEMNVKPHLVTSLERTIVVKTLMEGFNEEDVKDVYYTSCPVINNEVYQAYPGPRIIVYRNFDHFKWLGIDKGIQSIQISAGNMAFKVAEALGCDPIILIGQDLAYGRDGTTHALGTANTVDGKIQNNGHLDLNMIEVKANDGGTVMTNEGWYPCIKAYDLDVAGYQGTCINSTEGGAFIQGTVIMPFREAIQKYLVEGYYPLQRVKEILSSFTPEDAEKDYKKVIRLIDSAVEDMLTIKDNCRQGLEQLTMHRSELKGFLQETAIISETKKGRIEELRIAVLGPKEDSIVNYRHTFQLLFMHIIQSYNIKFAMEMVAVPEKYDFAEIATVEVLLRHEEWYSVIGELAEICLKLLTKTREKLQGKMPVIEVLL